MANDANLDILEPFVRQHVRRVYSTLSIALLAATAGASVHLFSSCRVSSMQAGLLSVFGALGLLAALELTPHLPKNQGKRLAYMLGFSFLSGMGLGPLLELAIYINLTIIPTALLGTVVIFGSFTLSALLSDKRQWLYLGGFLFTGLSWMCIMSLMYIFFNSQFLFQVELYFGLAIMCVFVLYDTQLIVEKRRHGDDDYIWHSVALFTDTIGIFPRLLINLIQRRTRRSEETRCGR